MIQLVAIGASWGGLHAVGRVLEDLPGDLGAAVVVAQHRGVISTELARLLGAHCALPVTEADDNEPVVAGRVYVAPPDYHLLVEPGRLALSVDEPVRFSRPSIDVLFESAADAYGARALGVVLTGANDDGAAGLARIKQRGGGAVVQDPAEAERPEMPAAALAATEVDAVLPLTEIGAFVARAVGIVAAERTASV